MLELRATFIGTSTPDFANGTRYTITVVERAEVPRLAVGLGDGYLVEYVDTAHFLEDWTRVSRED